MAERIMMTPSEIRDGASFMMARLGDITDQMTQLKGKVDDISSRWEGAAQNAYVSMFNESHSQVQTMLTDSVTGLSEALNAAANAIEQTDAEIASAFKG